MNFTKITFTVIVSSLLILTSCTKETPAPLPVANFYVLNSGCIAPCSVQFYDQSMHGVKWKWNFGNGNTSEQQNDTIYYENEGVYMTSLITFNKDNISDTIIKKIIIN